LLSRTRSDVQEILELYRNTPGTSGAARRADHRLAALLVQRRVPLDTIRAALLLATARRVSRPPDAPPLRPIATLHYFLPVIDELLEQPLDPGYLRYLCGRLAGLAPGLVASDHRLS